MGAFLSSGDDGDIGVWASNHERDLFLDWFAEHRCAHGDQRWEYCKSEGHRWAGCGIDLSDLIPRGEVFTVSPSERAEAAEEYWPDFAVLLDIISAITRGEWQHLVSSQEAISWRPEAIAREAKWQAEQQRLLAQPFRSSSFGTAGDVSFTTAPNEPINDSKGGISGTGPISRSPLAERTDSQDHHG